ncbi:MAG: prepilin-type N-terminal cleavage/methylation domain-containing protein [Deltaproteobacteria bacterium]|nr:prepilin-type N-terminal cleavage/methylation domain-containing protein [Deltaproteobacteria bacterium]
MGRMRNQKGFTLVEIAIVLVIIGLILGGILKGQEMIKNAKIKRIVKQADEIRAAVYSYQDRYQQLPGDDNDPTGHTGVAGLLAGNNNAQIAAAEAPDVFDHLEAAGFISGSFDGTNYAKHAFGDDFFVSWLTASAKTTHWFSYTNIPGEIGRIVDTSYDDGVNTTGGIRASAAYTTGVVTLYIEF